MGNFRRNLVGPSFHELMFRRTRGVRLQKVIKYQVRVKCSRNFNFCDKFCAPAILNRRWKALSEMEFRDLFDDLGLTFVIHKIAIHRCSNQLEKLIGTPHKALLLEASPKAGELFGRPVLSFQKGPNF